MANVFTCYIWTEKHGQTNRHTFCSFFHAHIKITIINKNRTLANFVCLEDTYCCNSWKNNSFITSFHCTK